MPNSMGHSPTGRNSLRRFDRSARRHDQRGLAFPSPVVALSILAVVMAGVAFFATGGEGQSEREISTVSQPEASSSESPSADAQQQGQKQDKQQKQRKKKQKKAVERSEVVVEVYNNSGITGLAGRTSSEAQGIGWQVVATDNWYGTIPGTTVYHPARLKQAAKVLARDLGIDRVQPAVDPMRMDRLTVILTGDRG